MDQSKTHRPSAQITITGHKIEDREYLVDRVGPMVASYFGVTMKVRILPYENTIVLYCYSKQIASTLNNWGMPFGLKKLSQLLPKQALDEVSFVRGIFDTDGCVYRKYGPYLQVQFKALTQN